MVCGASGYITRLQAEYTQSQSTSQTTTAVNTDNQNCATPTPPTHTRLKLVVIVVEKPTHQRERTSRQRHVFAVHCSRRGWQHSRQAKHKHAAATSEPPSIHTQENNTQNGRSPTRCFHAASTGLATAQMTALNAATDATTAEAAAATAANAHVTQARVAAIMANTEVEAAIAAVNALMIKPIKPFKPHGQAPTFDMEKRKDSFDVWETQWKIFIELSTIKDLVPGPKQPKYMVTLLLSCMSPNRLKP